MYSAIMDIYIQGYSFTMDICISSGRYTAMVYIIFGEFDNDGDNTESVAINDDGNVVFAQSGMGKTSVIIVILCTVFALLVFLY